MALLYCWSLYLVMVNECLFEATDIIVVVVVFVIVVDVVHSAGNVQNF